ncbi:MAG: hypothetical protein AB1522_14200 [Chloroflexota bacterium]
MSAIRNKTIFVVILPELKRGNLLTGKRELSPSALSPVLALQLGGWRKRIITAPSESYNLFIFQYP